MSVLFKILFGLLVIVCLVQFIEMAPEEETKDENTLIKEFSEKLKDAFSDENLKKFIDGASSALAEGAKTFESHMQDWKKKLDELNEKKE